MPGIWLDDDTYQQTAGQIWGQQQIQQIQAGETWAQQAMRQAIQPVQDQLSKLQSMVPAVPTMAPTPAPAPVQPPPPAPAPTPEPVATPSPITPAAPTPAPAPGSTPVAEPSAPPLPTAAPTPPPQAPTPEIPQVPTPSVAPMPTPSDTQQSGASWAQQQIDKLLNPQPPAAPQTTPGATPTPGPAQAPTPSTAPQTAPGGPIDNSSPQAFAQSIAPYAQAAAQKLGIDPTWVAAMAASESNYGKAPGNELFGIKATPGQASQTLATHEGEYGGTPQDASFAAYGSPQDAVDAFTNLIQNHYPGAVGAQTLGDFVHGLKQGGYFTAAEPEYKGILQGISDRIGGDVQSALQGGQQAVQGAISTGQTAVNTAVQGVQSAVARTSQFGMGLSSGDAMAFCGPAAAMAFAQTYGRNPTVDEAKQLAQQVGWNPNQGMAGVSSEVNLLNAMGVDAHASQGVDWSQVGRDASGGNPVILDTPGHYYYVDGYNQQTGQLHVGTSGTDLKGGSEWMTPDQINQMPQSQGPARAAIFADHPLAQQDGLAQSTAAQQPTTMGANQPATTSAPFSLPDISPGGIMGLGAAAAPGLLQTGQNLVNQILGNASGASSAVQSRAQDTMNAVLNVGGPVAQGAQDLLGQGANAVQGPIQAISQAPQTVQDMLTSNALLSQGIPTIGANQILPDVSALGAGLAPQAANIGGQALSSALGLPSAIGQLASSPTGQDVLRGAGALMGMPGGQIGPSLGTGNLADVLSPQTRQDLGQTLQNANVPVASGLLGGLLQAPSALDSMQTLQDLNQKYAGTPGATSIPMAGQAPLTLGVDPSQMTPEDRQAYNQSAMVVGQMAQPGAPTAGDWLKGAYRGGVIGGLNTMADVVANSTLTPALSGVSGTVRDLASLNPGRVAGRALGAQAGIVDWTGNFLQGLSDSLNRPGSLSARTSGVPGVIANLVEGAGALHGAFQNATSELIQSMERGSAAGGAASDQGLSGAGWLQEFQNQLQNPAEGVAERAQAMGDRTAARGDLGTLTGAFGRFVTNAGPVGDALFPVYRMGMSLASRMVESTPLGLAGTAADVARGMAGQGPYAALQQTGLRGALDVTPAGSAVGPIGERLTNNLIGTALSMWLANKAVGGAITGSGPSDPGEHQVWLANGNQPDSFMGPDGAYHSWQKLPPALRGPMMTAGAYADAVQAYNQASARQGTAGPQAYGVQDPRVAAASALVSEVGQQLASATPMRTFANLYDALQSNSVAGTAMTAGSDVASSILGGLVPASGLVRSVATMTDPTQRATLIPRTPQELPQSTLENVAQNIPGLRQGLPARVDVLGRGIPNPQQGLGEILPVKTAAGQPTPLLQSMQTAGVAPSAPPAAVNYGPYDQIALTPAEQRTWEQLRGQILQQSAASMTADPKFQASDPQSQRYALNLVDQIATQSANLQMLSVIGPSAQARAEPRPGGLTSPVVGYGPDVMSNQLMLQQQLRNQMQHQALMQSLLNQQAAG